MRGSFTIRFLNLFRRGLPFLILLLGSRSISSLDAGKWSQWSHRRAAEEVDDLAEAGLAEGGTTGGTTDSFFAWTKTFASRSPSKFMARAQHRESGAPGRTAETSNREQVLHRSMERSRYDRAGGAHCYQDAISDAELLCRRCINHVCKSLLETLAML